jgi:hypothetical protein
MRSATSSAAQRSQAFAVARPARHHSIRCTASKPEVQQHAPETSAPASSNIKLSKRAVLSAAAASLVMSQASRCARFPGPSTTMPQAFYTNAGLIHCLYDLSSSLACGPRGLAHAVLCISEPWNPVHSQSDCFTRRNRHCLPHNTINTSISHPSHHDHRAMPLAAPWPSPRSPRRSSSTSASMARWLAAW